MINKQNIINTITSLFPLNTQIEYIKSYTNRVGGTTLPAMDEEGKVYHQRLKREIIPLTLNFVLDKDDSLTWEKRVIGYSSVIKELKEDNFLNYFMIPGLESLAMGLFKAADIKDNRSINILVPFNRLQGDKENMGFVNYNQEQDALYFIIEYSFN